MNTGRDELLILSREGLTFSKKYNIERFAKNLKQSYPNARIIVIIREQFDLLITLYVWQTCKYFLTSSLNRYIAQLMNSQNKRYLLHNHAIRTYMDAFGRDRVLVLPYEMPKTQKSAFLRRLVDFIDPNLDYHEPATWRNISHRKRAVVRGVIALNCLLRVFFFLPFRLLCTLGITSRGPTFEHIEHRIYKFSRNKFCVVLDKLFPKAADTALSLEHFRAYGALFAEVNTEVEQLTGLDLAANGYATRENLENFGAATLSKSRINHKL